MTETKLTKSQDRTRTSLTKFIAEGHPVAVAVESLRAAAIERALERAREKIAEVAGELASAGQDANICAPYPRSGGMSRAKWLQAKAKYDLFRRLSSANEATTRPGAPDLRTMSNPACDRYLKDTAEAAAIQYDAFVVKLIAKVGEVVSAEVQADAGVWGRSVLIVQKPEWTERGTEKWLTQQIVNYSSLGTPYNQWPTRKIK